MKIISMLVLALTVLIAGVVPLFAETEEKTEVERIFSDPATLPQEMREKLDKIIIPNCHFEGANLLSVLRFISGKLKENDPEKHGIEIVYAEEGSGYEMNFRIDMKLQNISGLKLLQSLCRYVNADWFAEDGKLIIYFPEKIIPNPYTLPPQMREKLSKIMVSKKEFEDAPLATIMKYLNDILKENDPEKHGVEIILSEENTEYWQEIRLDVEFVEASGLDTLQSLCQFLKADWLEWGGVLRIRYAPEAYPAPLPDPDDLPEEMRNKLSQITIPKGDFKGITLTMAFKYISDVLKKLDPEKRGVEIALAPEDVDRATEIELDMILEDKPALEVIQSICQLVEADWRAEDGKLIIFFPAEEESALPDPDALPEPMRNKLGTIMIPIFEVKETAFPLFLKRISIELKNNDPEKSGVEIALAAEDMERGMKLKLNMDFKNKSGLEILQPLCQAINANWRAEDEKLIIFFLPDPAPSVKPPETRSE